MARAQYGEIEHDGDSDDETLSRTSGEVRRQDQETLNAEEEAEKLLHGQHDTDAFGGRSRVSKKGRRLGFAAVHVVIFVAFLLLVYGAYRATKAKGSSHDAQVPSQSAETSQQDEKAQHAQYTPETLSNGTHTFKPTTILISLDGFRADFLHRNISPTLASFIELGVSPKYMLPSFPSLTFPNHFTLVTGLHPESHGVVGNTFFDPEMDDSKGGRGRQFDYGDAAKSMQPEWWTAEPLWLTAEKQGLRTAVHMWPGSEAHIGGIDPAFVDKFNANEALDNKVRRILGWLDLPGEDESPDTADSRPQFIAAYVPDVDADGHAYGPNSTYIRSTIRKADSMLGMLFSGLEERNLTDVVNVVIVSDHGMATTSTKRLIQLEDLIDTSLIEHTDGWPLYGLRPYDTSKSNVKSLYKNLRKAAKTSKYKGAFEVYLRDDDMPERYHFSDNHRIAPLWIVPTAGWAIVTKDEFNVEAGLEQEMSYSPMGLHGYDNQHPLMRAIFVARGPAFPHTPGSLVDPFQNIEVYNIVCDSLGLKPAPNNGTLRLPLRPSGMHDGSADVPEDIQDDPSLALPPPDGLTDSSKGASATLPPEVANLANRPDLMVPTEGAPPVSEATPSQTSPPSGPAASPAPEGEEAPESTPDGDEKGKPHTSWWSWVTGKIDAMKGWASSFFGSKDEQKAKDDNQNR